MKLVQLEHETDFEGWRRAARALRLLGVPPQAVIWSVAGAVVELFSDAFDPAEAPGGLFPVPRGFVELAEDVVLHREPGRFDTLYRLLWRLRDEPDLLEIYTDYDVAEARRMRKDVDKAAYRMKQYVRFRKAQDPDGDIYVAWFEPAHRALEKAVPHFVNRYATMRWSILTPEATVVWDGASLTYGPGVSRDAAPEEDRLEDAWRAYFAATFNPARLKVKAMTAQMPKGYWRNLPEAAVIPFLIQRAGTRTETMVDQGPTQPNRRTAKAIARIARDGGFDDAFVPASTDEVWPAVQACRRCDLWRNATQGVAGVGPADASVMFVGEQPGDMEDLAGKPFVGPAGQLFDRALAEAGVPRSETYVTNAVKHFKFEPRGRRRIHRSPDAGEVKACNWWLGHERRLVKPKLVVALGATAGRAVFGRPVKVGEERGRPVPLEDGATGFLTVHPSYMLRLADAESKAQAYADFVADLRAAWGLLAA